MPLTPRAVKSSTTLICSSRSSSLSGPFQMISQPVSWLAFTAPAWMVFQNSCVVPLGMTAMVFFAELLPPDDPPPLGPVVGDAESDDLRSQEIRAKVRVRQPIARARRFM